MTCNTAMVTAIIETSIGLRGIQIFFLLSFFHILIENGIGSIKLLNEIPCSESCN